MFRKSVLRLTVGYLAGIMLLSGIFSVALYRASTRELDRFEQQQLRAFQRGFTIDFPILGDDFLQTRLEQVHEARAHILVWLLEFNAIVLVVGGAVGYGVAILTIRPIQRSWEAQARFTADASHELRTPLTTLRTENDVALRDPNLNLSEAKRLLRSNVEEVKKLTTLSNALLKLTQIQSQPSLWQSVSVQKIVTQAVERMQKAAELRQMTIETSVSDDTAHGDSDLLTEAVVVLLDNAVKYGHTGMPINVHGARDHQQLRISVTNHGAGIPVAEQTKIFERFYRGDQSRNKSTEGFGLGLSLAQDIVRAHHGTISVDSQVDAETTFTIMLPLRPLSRWAVINPFRV